MPPCMQRLHCYWNFSDVEFSGDVMIFFFNFLLSTHEFAASCLPGMMQLHCKSTCTQLWPYMKLWGRIVLREQQRVSGPCWNRTHIAQFTSTRLKPSNEKKVYALSCLSTLNRFFACWISIFGLLKSNLKARQDLPEFLTTIFCWYIFSHST